MAKILTICTSRNRPELLRQMIGSFLSTKSPDTAMVVSIDDDEPKMAEYQTILSIFQIPYFICMPKSVTEHVNDIWHAFQDEYDYFHITNDDVIYQTKGWDDVSGNKIFYCNDLLQGENLPTFPIVPRETCQAVGYLQMPRLDKFYGDSCWKEIGARANCLEYRKDYIIEHKHHLNDARTNDNPYYEAEYAADQKAFAQWLSLGMMSDVRKVQEVLLNGPRNSTQR